jgi:hypothetical protein
MPLPTPEDGRPQPATVRPPLQRSASRSDALITAGAETTPVVFELNLLHAGGVDAAYQAFAQLWTESVPAPAPARFEQYVLAHLPMTQIRALEQEDRGRSGRARAIHRVWPDFPMDLLTAVQAAAGVL